MRIALVGGRVFDGTAETKPGEACVLIEDDTILDVVASRNDIGDAVEIDVTGSTVMPGLIDTHIHFAMWGMDLIGHQASSLAYLCSETVYNMNYVLRGGCTTARDLGGLDAGFRDAVRDGLVPGPEIQTSITFLTPTSSVLDRTTRHGIKSPPFPGTPYPVCDGPDEVRQRVRECARAGADVIKIGTTGAVSSAKCPPWKAAFNRAETEAAVDEAHALELPIACHAVSGPGVAVAIEAGVDTLEHGAELTPRLADMLAEKQIWYIPTLAAYRLHAENGPDWKKARARDVEALHCKSVAMALKAGAPIAMGSDAGGYGLDFALELERLVEAGLTPTQALVAGTGDAARCIGVAERKGTLRKGMQSDVLVVDGDPFADVGIMRQRDKLAMVMKAGKAVCGRLAGAVNEASGSAEQRDGDLGRRFFSA
ncbi:MAG: amidohydrolase family protein [Flavobacteriaceae bacterium]